LHCSCSDPVQAEAALVGQVIAELKEWPARPADCRVKERAGVLLGDRLDVALIKYDHALFRANARIERCDEWYQKQWERSPGK